MHKAKINHNFLETRSVIKVTILSNPILNTADKQLCGKKLTKSNKNEMVIEN